MGDFLFAISRFVHLQFAGLASDLPCRALPQCAVLLCGNTSERCRELARLVKQVLGVLSSWLQEVPSAGGEEEKEEEEGGQRGRLVALRGGGAWELAVAKELERSCLRQTCPK